MKSQLLSLDAGQTKIRISLENQEEEVLEFPGIRTDLEIVPQLGRVITKALENREGEWSVAAGVSGLVGNEQVSSSLFKNLPDSVSDLYLAHDSITGYLGSIGLSTGTVTAVGTGVVTLAVSATACARVDGWGNLIGDAGSAYWIGRMGLDWAMRSYDGRAAESKLLDIILANFASIEGAYIELQTNPERVRLIASFAKEVIELADSDALAAKIVKLAGEELANSALAAARRAGLDRDHHPKFSWTGNVMKSQKLLSAFEEAILAEIPAAELVAPIGEPINGVSLLPQVPRDSALASQVAWSSR